MIKHEFARVEEYPKDTSVAVLGIGPAIEVLRHQFDLLRRWPAHERRQEEAFDHLLALDAGTHQTLNQGRALVEGFAVEALEELRNAVAHQAVFLAVALGAEEEDEVIPRVVLYALLQREVLVDGVERDQ